MKIRTKARLSAFLAVGVIVTVTVVYMVTAWQLRRVEKELEQLKHLSRETTDLVLLTSDYLRNHSPRAKTLWYRKFARIKALSADLAYPEPDGEPMIRQAIHVHMDMLGLFQNLVASREGPLTAREENGSVASKLDRRLAGQLTARTHEAVSLNDMSQARVVEREYRLRAWERGVLQTCLLALLVGVVAFGVSTHRGIVRPIRHLQRQIGAVGTGNLDQEVRINTNDELGELASSFNAMTRNLKRVTASRDELDDEVRERNRAEKRLNETLAELKRSNRDLEQFAYAASHDLQEPLRKVLAFGERLESQCGGALDESGRDYLNRMCNAATRMQALINDLLTFSRITSRAHGPEQIDLNKVAAAVLEDLETRIEETGGRVTVDPLPCIAAEAMHMRLLLQNLIANALKFHRPGQPPEVRVYSPDTAQAGAQAGGGNGRIHELVVTDNGIGFDNTYRDRIFGVFQRLHPRTEYEGTGVGLAICQRIVEWHGGEIEADGKLGQGAKFTIRLPANPLLQGTPDTTL